MEQDRKKVYLDRISQVDREIFLLECEIRDMADFQPEQAAQLGATYLGLQADMAILRGEVNPCTDEVAREISSSEMDAVDRARRGDYRLVRQLLEEWGVFYAKFNPDSRSSTIGKQLVSMAAVIPNEGEPFVQIPPFGMNP